MDVADRIVVTGGAGFIGSHLVDLLLSSNVSLVTVLDNFARGRRSNLARWSGDPRLRVIDGDIRDVHVVADAVSGADVVYHLAAQATVMGAATNIDYTFSTNVDGTYNVLKAAAEAGVRRCVFASSREVYGEPVGLPVDESHPLLSINIYGASKVAGEALCRAFTRETKVATSVLRLANVYGIRDFGRVIPHWIQEAREGRELLVYGGDQIIDFIWVGQVAQALLRAGSSDLLLPPINVASGTGTKILDLARRIGQLTRVTPRIQILPRRSIEVTRYIGNTDRMTQLLGLLPAEDPLSELAGIVRPLAGVA